MQVSPQSPPLLLACRHQPHAGLLQITSQTHRVYGHPRLSGEVIEQAAIRGAERFARRTAA